MRNATYITKYDLFLQGIITSGSTYYNQMIITEMNNGYRINYKTNIFEIKKVFKVGVSDPVEYYVRINNKLTDTIVKDTYTGTNYTIKSTLIFNKLGSIFTYVYNHFDDDNIQLLNQGFFK